MPGGVHSSRETLYHIATLNEQRRWNWEWVSKVACMCFSAINASSPAYLSELLHDYTPSRAQRGLLLTHACWKSSSTNARLMASAFSLALDPTFEIHSHKTLDTAQLTLRAPHSGTFLQTLPDLVTSLKGHSLFPRSCLATRSALSESSGY